MSRGNRSAARRAPHRNIKFRKIPGKDSQIEIDAVKVRFLRPVKEEVFDSKMPVPLLIEFEKEDFIFQFIEGQKSGFFNNKSGKVIFVPSLHYSQFNTFSEKFGSGIIICRECKESFENTGSYNKIYETLTNGSIKITFRDNMFDIAEFIKL